MIGENEKSPGDPGQGRAPEESRVEPGDAPKIVREPIPEETARYGTDVARMAEGEMHEPSPEEVVRYAKQAAAEQQRDQEQLREARNRLELLYKANELRGQLLPELRANGLEHPEVVAKLRLWVEVLEATAGDSRLERIGIIREQASLFAEAGLLQEALEELGYARVIAEQERDSAYLEAIDASMDDLEEKLPK